jgi:hypothetical protein
VITQRLQELAAQLDTLLDDIDLQDVGDDRDGLAAAAAAVAALRARGVDALAEATPYVWEYYREVAEVVGVGEDVGVPDIADGADIWEHVRFRNPPTASPGGSRFAPAPCYVSFDGGVDWEPEHGLELVFDHVGALTRVGPHSGHNTVAAAYADASKIGTIYG